MKPQVQDRFAAELEQAKTAMFWGKFRTLRGGKANAQSVDQSSIPDDIRQLLEQ